MLYSLSEIQVILQNGFEYTLPNTILQSLERIEKEIDNSSIKKMYSASSSSINTNVNISNKNTDYLNIRNKHSSNISSVSSSNNSTTKFKDKDLSWENIRNFKVTKMEKKEGTDKIINDIRICLNKMSNKNYEIQRTAILEFLHNMGEPEDCHEDLQKVASAIFDIASTNKFYSEMYAKIYKELMDVYPIFRNILDDFLLQFLNTVSDLKYVDPNIDYDAYCNYNKQNDKKKATAVFIIHMMKQTVILPKHVLDIIHHLIQKVDANMNTENQLNELEEMTELLNLFILEGYVFLSSSDSIEQICKENWQSDLVKIHDFSKLKIKDKLSLSSRVIFKYMDICSFMDKNKNKK